MTAECPDAIAPSAASRLAGCLLAQALGDALGFVVEGAPAAVARRYAAALPHASAILPARSPFSPGQYSDDTQYARELCASIVDAGEWRADAFARRLARLFAAGRDVGAGAGSRRAARRLLLGVDWREAGTPPPYAGNGAAIRAGPIGVLFRGDPLAMRRVAIEQALVTHREPLCAAGAVAIAAAVRLAATEEANAETALASVGALATEVDARFGAAFDTLGELLSLPPAAAAERLRAARLDPLGPPPTGGLSIHVVPTVIWSLYSVWRHPSSWREALGTAIGIGGDTDSTGAMAGAIVGARLGAGALPAALLAQLHDRGTDGAAALTALAGRCVASVLDAPPSRP